MITNALKRARHIFGIDDTTDKVASIEERLDSITKILDERNDAIARLEELIVEDRQTINTLQAVTLFLTDNHNEMVRYIVASEADKDKTLRDMLNVPSDSGDDFVN